MNELITALDDKTQHDFKQVLERERWERLGELRAEVLAALAVLGRHPAHLRPAAVSILSIGLREELYAEGLAERRGTGPQAWKLTSRGDEVASALAESLPAPDEEAQARAEESRAKRRAELEEKLGPLG